MDEGLEWFPFLSLYTDRGLELFIPSFTTLAKHLESLRPALDAAAALRGS